MTLTSAYDAAKTASQLTASDIPSDYAKPGDAMTLTSAYDAAKTASQLTAADIPSDYAKPGDAMTLTSAYDAAKTASQLTSADLSGLSTFDPTNDTVLIDATQAAGMATATGFATPSDISGAVSALETYGDNHWTGGSSGGATAQQIWEYPTRTITASPTDVSGLATASALSAVASNVAAVKAKTDNLPASPAAVGSAMTLTSAYDAAKTASQLTSADLPSDYAKPGDAMTLTATYDAAKTASQLTAADIPSDYAKPGDAMTLTSAYDAAKTASQLTAADLSGLSTFDPTTDTVLIDATQAAGMATANDISGAVSDLETYGDNHWTGGSSGGATAQQIWEYPTRTITASPTDVSGLATASALSAVASNVAAVKAKTDNLPASPAAVGSAMTLTSAYDAAKTASQLTSADLPSDYAKPGDAMTLTATYDAAKTASQLTAADIPSDYAKPGDAMTLTSAYDAAKTASQLTAADLSGLSTFDPTTDTVLIDATQAAGMATANDISGAVSDLETYGDNHWTGGSSGGATAQQIWEYPTRTITASPTDVSGLATASDLSAVASNVAAVKAKTDNLPASPAATGDIPTSKINSVYAGLYNWRLQNNGAVEKITAKDASGNTLAQSTITRDNDGNIIRMDEETE